MANFGTDPSSEDNWTMQEPHADDIDGDGDDGDANEYDDNE